MLRPYASLREHNKRICGSLRSPKCSTSPRTSHTPQNVRRNRGRQVYKQKMANEVKTTLIRHSSRVHNSSPRRKSSSAVVPSMFFPSLKPSPTFSAQWQMLCKLNVHRWGAVVENSFLSRFSQLLIFPFPSLPHAALPGKKNSGLHLTSLQQGEAPWGGLPLSLPILWPDGGRALPPRVAHLRGPGLRFPLQGHPQLLFHHVEPDPHIPHHLRGGLPLLRPRDWSIHRLPEAHRGCPGPALLHSDLKVHPLLQRPEGPARHGRTVRPHGALLHLRPSFLHTLPPLLLRMGPLGNGRRGPLPLYLLRMPPHTPSSLPLLLP